MKFKTIVITKRKIAAVGAVCILCASLLLCWRLIPDRAISAFNAGDDLYESILRKGLPDGREKNLSLKGVLKKLLGFDIENPETIISEYSPAFDGTNSESEGEESAEPSPAPEKNEEERSTEEPPLADKGSICSPSDLKVNNATNYNIDLNELCAKELAFEINYDEPQVLVMHTHTTECYDGDEMNGETERNTDSERNVIAVGSVICETLEENGIKTIHDTTYHDYPSYQGSYARALTTIENQLKNNPSIKIVLDIHRDAFVYSDGTKLSVSCDINGMSTAQVMIVAGTDSMGLWHNNWRENLAFAAKIQNAAQIMYPGLMRPINLRTERFNEHATSGSLILEVGSNGNTLDEAKRGGRDAARAVAAVLLSTK